MRKTVLVLGAGASKEVDMPVGEGLRHEIAKLLTFVVNEYQLRDGDASMIEALRYKVKRSESPDLNPYLRAARQVVGAMPQALSIDNYLHQRRDDKIIEFVGKLAIVRAILKDEANSTLSAMQDEVDLKRSHATWFNRFFMMLTEGCEKSELSERLSRVEVVSFNYDRCFEHHLYHSLMNVYNLDPPEAAALAQVVPVHHPYGQVGHLPWCSPGTLPWSANGLKVEYGASLTAPKLVELTAQIKTFTEGTDPASPQLAAIRDAVKGAQRIVFLGFGFHDQNVALIYGDPKGTFMGGGNRECFATLFGESQQNAAMIKSELGSIEVHGNIYLQSGTCAQFINDHSRQLRRR